MSGEKKVIEIVERKPRIEEKSIFPKLQAVREREAAAEVQKAANEAKNPYTLVFQPTPPPPITKALPIPNFRKVEESATYSPIIVSPKKPNVPENVATSESLNSNSEKSSADIKEAGDFPPSAEKKPSEPTTAFDPEASNRRNIPTGRASPRLAEPEINYIRLYFKRFPPHEYKEFLRLRDSYFEQKKLEVKKKQTLEGSKNISDDELALLNNSVEDQNDILGFFKPREDDNEDKGQNYFDRGGSPFCCKVRDTIMEFEQNRMEIEEPSLRVWLWKQRQDELFCLKYLCKKSVELKNDLHLINFINEMKDLSKDGLIWSQYNALKDNLKAVMSEYRANKADYRAKQWMDDVEKNEMREEIKKLERKLEDLNKGIDIKIQETFDAKFAEHEGQKTPNNNVFSSINGEERKTPRQEPGLNLNLTMRL